MISTKGRYALRVMLDLAEHADEAHVPLKDISKKYLEIIVKSLVEGRLIEGISGKGGGYRLCRKPEEYSVGEILELTEGSLATVACLSCGAPRCERASDCKTLPLWFEFDRMTHDFFYGRKLSDLIEK